jgi:hypothetical protein
MWCKPDTVPANIAGVERIEQVVMGTQAQVLAAAYESVVMRGNFIERFEPYRSQFSFREYNRIVGVVVDITVAARAIDDTHTRVVVTARDADAESHWGDTFGLNRRAAQRVIDHLEDAWAKPLRALADPGWYPDPLHLTWTRYWDGAGWTPWVWCRDGLALDFNGDPDIWVATDAPATFNLGLGGVTIRQRPWLWLPPPLYNEHVLLGKRRVDRLVFKWQALALVPMLVGLLVVTLLVSNPWAESSRAEPDSVALSNMFGRDTPQPAAATAPVGQWHRYDDGVSVRVIGYTITPSEPTRTDRDLDVDVEVCTRSGVAIVQSSITVVTADARYVGRESDTTHEPAFRGGSLRAGCRRGWITAVVPADAQPTEFDWGGFGRGHARWLVA